MRQVLECPECHKRKWIISERTIMKICQACQIEMKKEGEIKNG